MGNYYLYLFAYYFTRALPLSVAHAFGIFIADCHYLLSKNDRKEVEANLKVILKTDHIKPAQVRQVFRNFGRYLAEFFTMTKHLNDDFIRTRVKIDGLENLNEAIKHGKGCIVASAHLGNWEMAGAVLSKLGYPLSVVALQHRDPRVNKFFNDQREFFGTIVIPTTTAIRRCIEHLKANRLVAILAERDFTPNGMVMNFLGRPTIIPKGSALFSLKTGAPIVTCFLVRDGDGFKAEFNKPIYPQVQTDGKATDEQLEHLIKPYIKEIEAQIYKNPTQWLTFKEFWVS